MRLLRKFVNAHYNFLLRELPDGLTNEGAFISTYVGRPLAAAGIEWLRSKGATSTERGLSKMIDRVVVDFVKTFGRPGIFLAVEPKMERADKSDPNSQQVQARDKNGDGLKWLATVVVVVKSFDREKYENLSITLTAPTQPCANIATGAAKRNAQVRHAVKVGRGLATVLVIIIEDCLVEDVIVLQRDELAVRGRAQPHALLRSGTMPNRLEHHFAAHDDFDGLSELSRRRDRQRTMGPRPQLAAETRADEFGDDADVLFRQTEHLREHALKVNDPLR